MTFKPGDLVHYVALDGKPWKNRGVGTVVDVGSQFYRGRVKHWASVKWSKAGDLGAECADKLAPVRLVDAEWDS